MFYYRIMNKFAERFKELRVENGLTRVEIAQKLNVSARLISYWESGQRECDFDTLIKIANVFSVNLNYLLGVTEY